jgi:predicted RND superfamily exporter protein
VKKLFYIVVIGLILFDFLNVYFIMPIPLAADNKSFFAFDRPTKEAMFLIENDTLSVDSQSVTLNGNSIGKSRSLRKIKTYQDFWHS